MSADLDHPTSDDYYLLIGPAEIREAAPNSIKPNACMLTETVRGTKMVKKFRRLLVTLKSTLVSMWKKYRKMNSERQRSVESEAGKNVFTIEISTS